MHDVLAELQGYRNELAQAQRRGDTETAAAVQAEIDRVSATARSVAASHAGDAARHHDAGAHALAAKARAEAARYRDAAGPGSDDTADHTELETAVTPKRARTRKDTV